MKRALFLLFIILGIKCGFSQTVSGYVVDSKSNVALPYVNVYYEGKGVGGLTNEKGFFSVPYNKKWNNLTFSCVGYTKKTVPITDTIKGLRIQLEMSSNVVSGVKIVAQKKKYNRRNNPAVELMRKVIAAKKKKELSLKPFFSYNKYQKISFALNDITPKVLEEGTFKKMPFLKNRVELSPETGKLILPISVNEMYTEHIYRKDPKSEKDIVMARKVTGLNDFFSTGDMLTTLLEDVFTDVDVYDNNIRLLQTQFVSPISSTNAINFYRFFIADTTVVGVDSCYEVTFTPNNPQDFGFTGSLYVMKDSTYRLRKVLLNLPKRSGVNFVDNLQVTQEFEESQDGGSVLTDDNMIVQINVVGSVSKLHVKRATHYSNYCFDEIPEKRFKIVGKEKIENNAMIRDASYWNKIRPYALSEKENSMDDFLQQMQKTKGFKFVLFVAKAFIENFVETSTDIKKPSKVDIGPINTIFSHNFVDGFRLRASAQTTANLNPHLFAKGYIAYGFKDQRWKGMGELTYSFNKKEYLPREFPVRNLTVSYQNDVMSPSDKFMPTDKDNVFTSLKWTDANHMMYVENLKLKYDHEWGNGLRLTTQIQHEKDKPTAKLFYQPMNGNLLPTEDQSKWTKQISLSDIQVRLHYQPGATFLNTKQRRIATNHDSPIYELVHTMGLKFLGSDYAYNLTEASLFKRFYIPASWGRIDVKLSGGIQWNTVPFPLLCMPQANLSYIKERDMFTLIRNMEFLNDRYVSLMTSWNMNGKIFNRIPLLKKLKWREWIGANFLWGDLTEKNNPFLEKNKNNSRLFYFPGEFKNGQYKYISEPMGNKPYVELILGVHNIFKIVHVEYVRRITYLSNPKVKKWGIRLMMQMSF